MSLLERRLQILLDTARYDLIAQEAERSGRSVAAVIREAIDLRFPDDEADTRASAARTLLELSEESVDSAGESPAELKEAYARELAAKAGSR